MKDYLGYQIEVGDNIVYLSYSKTSSQFVTGIAVGFTPKKVKIKYKSMYGNPENIHAVESHKVLVINKLID